jgi:hypothetical protein
MKKNLDLDLKRMLSLLESKLGDAKPILAENYDSINQYQVNENLENLKEDDKNPENIDRLEQLLKSEANIDGCKKMGDGSWSTFDDVTVKNLTNNQDGRIKVGDKYGWVSCNNVPFLVTNKVIDTNKLVVVKYEDIGGKKTYTVGKKSFPELFQRTASVTSDKTNLTASQQGRIDQFISNLGVGETGYSLTTKRPDGSEGVDYIAVDLATGIGKVNGNDVQIIKKLATDNLDPEFKTPNKYYVWARIGTKTQLADKAKFVEKKLSEWGYTKSQQEIENSPDDQILFGMVTTLEDFCSTTICPPEFYDYMKTNPNAKIWPKTIDAAQKAGASVQRGVKGSLRRQTRELGGGQRECKRQVDVYEKCLGFYTNNKSTFGANCITSIKNLGGNFASIPSLANGLSMIKNNIKDCANNLKGDYSASIQKFFGLPDGHPLKLSSGSEPEEDKTKAMMESTISDSIRTIINEHLKKENKDNLNTIIKKNLRRFL